MTTGRRPWLHADFLRLWTGQSLSQLGDQVTLLALPTVAIRMLGAGPAQIGLLSALAFVAYPTLGLVAGVWADRVRRRRLMIACDVGRMLVLATVPVAAFAGVLSMAQLFVVALLTGVCSVFFEISYQAYLPSLVDRSRLLEANARLEVTRSIALVAGPALTGVLIQGVRAAPAILADVASFLCSVLTLASIRRPEPRIERERSATFHGQMAEGVRVVLGNPLLRSIVACTATSNLAANMMLAVLLVFAYGPLRLGPAQVGAVFAAGSLGAVLGAFAARPFADLVGVGPALTASVFAGGLALFLVPAAGAGHALAVLAASMFVTSLSVPVYNVNQVSLRQALVPHELQGRMNATARTVAWGTFPIGAALGGLLGARAGIVPTLVLAAVLGTAAGLWLLAGPVRLRRPPSPDMEGAT